MKFLPGKPRDAIWNFTGGILACVYGKENEPKIGERYRVEETFSSSGVVEVTAYRWQVPDGTVEVRSRPIPIFSPFWCIYLTPVVENPCTKEDMESIST